MYFVLTQSRSGSSLLMQTLAHLGVDAGPAFGRIALPNHDVFNPKGFYEGDSASRVYNKGLNHDLFSRNIYQLKNQAFKCDLERFIGSLDSAAIELAEKSIKAIFVTYRHPVEQANSFYQLRTHNSMNSRDKFIFVCEFYKNYAFEYPRLGRLLIDKLNNLRTRVLLVDFHDSVNNPEIYVKRIKQSAGLKSTPRQVDSAIQNIDPLLYNYKMEDMNPESLDWCEKLGALRVYEIMRNSESLSVWNELSSLIPESS